MTTAAEAVLATLSIPGRTLAFCDETDLTAAPTSAMAGEIHAWVALVMPSAGYSGLEATLVSYRGDHGLPELHGTEMVNPKPGTPWKAVPFAARIFDTINMEMLVALHGRVHHLD